MISIDEIWGVLGVAYKDCIITNIAFDREGSNSIAPAGLQATRLSDEN